jgi:predicted dehydrogenase
MNGTIGLSVPKKADPLRFGVLGAADFSPVGLFDPASTHPDVLVVAIGARSLTKAQAQASKWNVPLAFGSYQEVLDQPDIDAVYIPLPIAHHAEWTIKAVRAGKHVLCEKVLCCNQDEARAVQKAARETGKVVLEAFHWQFHPVNHVLRTLINSGKFGRMKSIATEMRTVFAHTTDDIRLTYELGGGGK